MPNTQKCNCIVAKAKFNVKHSALYCVDCDVWIEPICNKAGCSYCMDRPAKPSEVKDEG